MTVLLITKSDDNPCVDRVAAALKKRGVASLRVDTDLYPTVVSLSTEYNTAHPTRLLHVPSGTVELSQVTALWYRRFAAGTGLPEHLGDLRQPGLDEARRTLYGTIASLDCFQLDPLASVRLCDHKELQLRRAQALGLDVPKTLFTNNPMDAVRFRQEVGEVVTKMQNSFAVYRGDEELVVFTTEVGEADDKNLWGLRYSPMTFQEKLPKQVELRATVVGKRVFTASIDSQASEDARIDWRRDGVGLLRKWKHYALPKRIERALLKLVASFGLQYAAADFVVTPDGRTVFLEINAGGEFFWLEEVPGLPISEALADVLSRPSARASTAKVRLSGVSGPQARRPARR